MVSSIMSKLRPEDIVWITGVAAAALASAVEKLSTKHKPWTWLLKQIGRGINADVLKKLDEHEEKINTLILKDKVQDEEAEKKDALAARRRILRFADEIRRKERHSEEYFNNILDDIKDYQNYCDTHPGFKNDKAIMSIEIIDECWIKCVKDNDFL